jgi:leader peptidase (prepilin peptidase)/N-methyltransferase
MEGLLWPILGGVSGLIAGSFLATLVLRWPRCEQPIGRSRCESCGAQLGAAELVPLLSYALQRGRCRRCNAPIDRLHPIIELAAAAIGLIAFAAVPNPAGFAGALLGWILLALIVLDMQHQWLPDALTLPLLGLGLVLGPAPLPDRLLAAGLGGSVLLAIRFAYQRLRGREGLGLGDVKLMAALGAWLSPAFLPPLLLVAALIGFAMAGLLRLRGQPVGPEVRLPFGACLAMAGFPMWLALAATSGG